MGALQVCVWDARMLTQQVLPVIGAHGRPLGTPRLCLLHPSDMRKAEPREARKRLEEGIRCLTHKGRNWAIWHCSSQRSCLENPPPRPSLLLTSCQPAVWVHLRCSASMKTPAALH